MASPRKINDTSGFTVQRWSEQLYAIHNAAGDRVGVMVFNPRIGFMNLGAWDISRLDTKETLDCSEMYFEKAWPKALKLFAALNPPAVAK